MYEMLYGRPPYLANNHIQLQKLYDRRPILKTQRSFTFHKTTGEVIQGRVSEDGIRFLEQLLKVNVLERLSFEELFCHKYLQTSIACDPAPSRIEYAIPKRRSEGSLKCTGDLSSFPRSSLFSSGDQSSRFLHSLSLSATSLPAFARFSTKLGNSSRSSSGYRSNGSLTELKVSENIDLIVGDFGSDDCTDLISDEVNCLTLIRDIQKIAPSARSSDGEQNDLASCGISLHYILKHFVTKRRASTQYLTWIYDKIDTLAGKLSGSLEATSDLELNIDMGSLFVLAMSSVWLMSYIYVSL